MKRLALLALALAAACGLFSPRAPGGIGAVCGKGSDCATGHCFQGECAVCSVDADCEPGCGCSSGSCLSLGDGGCATGDAG